MQYVYTKLMLYTIQTRRGAYQKRQWEKGGFFNSINVYTVVRYHEFNPFYLCTKKEQSLFHFNTYLELREPPRAS